MSIRFAWNRKKAARNVRKHSGVSFDEAATIFRDPFAYTFDDEAHSKREHRELIIGYSDRRRVLIVSFTERNDLIRIISARKADAGERFDYENAKR